MEDNMFKKVFSLVLVVTMALSLVACGGGSSVSSSGESGAKAKDASVCKEEGCYQSVFQDGYCKDHLEAKMLKDAGDKFNDALKKKLGVE